jgi:sugar O-acyltransferase (sialic acid O-acetyltransferase NeuD family)
MVIIGAGGHAIEVLRVLLDHQAMIDISFFDNTPQAPNKISNSYPVINSTDLLAFEFTKNPDFVLAVGNPQSRKKLFDLAVNAGGKPCSAISNTAILSQGGCETGVGLNIMHRVFVSENTKIGDGVLLNYNSSVHHDVSIGEFAEISPGSQLLGGVEIGKYAQIGAGAIVLPRVKVGNNAVIGAGAVVTKDLPSNSVAVGIPAKVIKYQTLNFK